MFLMDNNSLNNGCKKDDYKSQKKTIEKENNKEDEAFCRRNYKIKS